MWKRFRYLFSLFLLWMLIFALQKPAFMLYNAGGSNTFSFTDICQVVWNGMKLDSTMASYFLIFPFLCVLVSIWYNKIPWKRILKIYYIFVSIIMMLAFIADASLYPFWGFKLDATVLNYIDSPTEAMASVSTAYVVIRVVAIILLTVFAWWLTALIPIHFDKLRFIRQSIAGTFGMMLLGGVMFLMIRGGFSESTSNVGRVYYSSRLFLNHSAVNPCFSFMSSLGKNDKFEDEFNFYSEEKRAQFFNGLYPQNDNTLTDTLLNITRPNVLIIQVESFGGIFVEPIGGIKDVTPNFNKLTKEGVFFTNFYANSFRTDKGTVCTFSGYLGLPTTSIMKMPVKSQTLSSIAANLHEVGYQTDFLYGGDIDFTNMRSYLLSNGYQQTTAMEDFSLKEQHSNAWGVNDDITFDWLYHRIVERKDSLWHTGFLTLSSHEPFEVPYHRLEDKKLNSVAYFDDCLGKFIERLKSTPAWKNLLIICLPDHSMKYDGVEVHDPRFFHVPMLWLGGAVKQPKIVDKLVNQSDLAATLLSQLRLSHGQYPFSRNVFGSRYAYPFVFSCFNNGFLFKDSTGITVYDNEAEKILLDEPNSNIVRLERGKAILQTLYDDLGKR